MSLRFSGGASVTRTSWLAAVVLAVALGGLPAPSMAQPNRPLPPRSAEAFAHRILARLNGGNARFAIPETTAWYDAVFLRLFHDNLTLSVARHTESLMDTNPVCGCADAGGNYQLISTLPQPSGRVWARFRGSYEGQSSEYTIVFKQIEGGWRIFDVIDGGHSTRAFLTTHVACLRAARSDAAAELCSAP